MNFFFFFNEMLPASKQFCSYPRIYLHEQAVEQNCENSQYALWTPCGNAALKGLTPSSLDVRKFGSNSVGRAPWLLMP